MAAIPDMFAQQIKVTGKAVSYTHLDVYKRQGLLSADRRFLPLLSRGATCMLFEYSTEISGG